MPQQDHANSLITEDEIEAFVSILAIFESQKSNLKYIVNWPVTIKPWPIYNALEKRASKSKSLLRNSLLDLCPSLAEPAESQINECCIVDAMKAVRIIPISDLDDCTFTY